MDQLLGQSSMTAVSKLKLRPFSPQRALVQTLDENGQGLDHTQRLQWRLAMLEREVGLVQTQVEVCSWAWRLPLWGPG